MVILPFGKDILDWNSNDCSGVAGINAFSAICFTSCFVVVGSEAESTSLSFLRFKSGAVNSPPNLGFRFLKRCVFLR